jgi:hypothetical protein
MQKCRWSTIQHTIEKKADCCLKLSNLEQLGLQYWYRTWIDSPTTRRNVESRNPRLSHRLFFPSVCHGWCSQPAPKYNTTGRLSMDYSVRSYLRTGSLKSSGKYGEFFSQLGLLEPLYNSYLVVICLLFK